MKIIDIHIHGGYGINFNTAKKEEIIYLLQKLHARGITAVCPTLVGDNEDVLYNRLNLLKEIKKEHAPGQSYIIGVHLEGTFLNPDKPGIQDKNTFLVPNIENFKRITRDAKDIVKIVTLAPELDTNGELTKYLESKNIRVHAGHTTSYDIGFCSGTTHHYNAMPPISHRGQNLALDALLNNNIYCEIIADGLHVGENMLKLFFKVKDFSKIIPVSDALPCAGTKGDIVFCGKKINGSGRDDNGTIAGSVMFLDQIINYILKKGIINADKIKTLCYDNVLEHLDLNSDEINKIDKN